MREFSTTAFQCYSTGITRFFLLDDFVVQCNLVGGLVPVKAGVHAIPDVAAFWLRSSHGSLFSGGKSLVLMRIWLHLQSQFPQPSSMQRAHSSRPCPRWGRRSLPLLVPIRPGLSLSTRLSVQWFPAPQPTGRGRVARVLSFAVAWSSPLAWP